MPSAAAAPATRGEYAVQANQICATTNAQSDALLSAFLKKQHKVGKQDLSGEPDSFLDKPVRRLSRRRVKLFDTELAQLRLLPAAPGDEAIVNSWLALRSQEAELGKQVKARARVSEKGVEKRLKTAGGRAKQRRLDRKVEELLKQAEGLEMQDSALAAQLGATLCYPSAANGEAIGSLANEG